MATAPAPQLDRSSITRSHLNPGQQSAADAVFAFLFSNDRTMKISGGGGVGKTFLMLYIIKEVFNEYVQTCQLMGMDTQFESIDLTATTNKAAEVLAKVTGYPASTIQSYLGLTVYNDFKTGESKLTRGRKWKPVHNRVIFIDECSFIDRKLEKEILGSTIDCKIIYVGDHCQLAPIKEPISPIYNKADPMMVLTQPMRNADQPALQAICQQLRETVETGVFKPIHTVPGVIDYIDDAQFEQLIAKHFTAHDHNDKILAYTNDKVIAFNDHIRTLRHLPNYYTVGEILISNSACHTPDGLIPVERELEIRSMEPARTIKLDAKDGQVIEFVVQDTVARSILGSDEEGTIHGADYRIPVPVDRDHHQALIKYFARQKDWPNMYYLKDEIPDLRARDASTVHKAQGSSYDTVFIDFSDMNKVRQADVMARMLYVAFTRARTRIYLYGILADKFGGMVIH